MIRKRLKNLPICPFAVGFAISNVEQVSEILKICGGRLCGEIFAGVRVRTVCRKRMV